MKTTSTTRGVRTRGEGALRNANGGCLPRPQVEGVKIPTVSLDVLIRSKRTRRLQDAADIEVLEEIKRLRG